MAIEERRSAKEYVQENIKQTEKGYQLPMPELKAYPSGGCAFMVGTKPVPAHNQSSLFLLELEYEFKLEVTRREKAKHLAA